LADHLKFLFKLQEQHVLLAAGSLDLDAKRIEGMCISRAQSREAAETIGPAGTIWSRGLRTNTVRAWQLNEGLLVVAVKEELTL
jgi:uncharacterized protein YciI